MPYISRARAEAILDHNSPDNAGELNFAFTTIAAEYIRRKGLRYQYVNDVIGALEGAKLELYARVARPYEDTKIEENGDVYPKEILSE